MMYQSKTTKLYYVYYCFRATCFESYTEPSSGTSKNTDPYLAMFKIGCGIPNAYILDITMYQMLVSFCSYFTTHVFDTWLYQECKRLGSHSAF